MSYYINKPFYFSVYKTFKKRTAEEREYGFILDIKVIFSVVSIVILGFHLIAGFITWNMFPSGEEARLFILSMFFFIISNLHKKGENSEKN